MEKNDYKARVEMGSGPELPSSMWNPGSATAETRRRLLHLSDVKPEEEVAEGVILTDHVITPPRFAPELLERMGSTANALYGLEVEIWEMQTGLDFHETFPATNPNQPTQS